MAQKLLKAAKEADWGAMNEALAEGANVDVCANTFGFTVLGVCLGSAFISFCGTSL